MRVIQKVAMPKRRPTGFTDLPTELTGMILEHLMLNMKINHPNDLKRWHDSDSAASECVDPSKPWVFEYHIYCYELLCPNQDTTGRVAIVLQPRTIGSLLLGAEHIAVLIPRRWHELLESGLFRDDDLIHFAQHMNIELTSRNCVKTPPTKLFVLHVRALQAMQQIIASKERVRVFDLRLPALRVPTVSIEQYLPQLQYLEIYHESETIWPAQVWRSHSRQCPDLDILHVVTQQEADDLNSSGMLPTGLIEFINRRELCLEYAWGRKTSTVMPLTVIQEHLASTGWTGKVRQHIVVKCIAEGSEGWMSSRVAMIAVVLDLDRIQGWTILGAAISGEEYHYLGLNAWASLKHLNM